MRNRFDKPFIIDSFTTWFIYKIIILEMCSSERTLTSTTKV